MREALKPYEGKRRRFKGVILRFGRKPCFIGDETKYRDTIVIGDVTDVESGMEVSDHCWLTLSTTTGCKKFQVGNIVEFDATVLAYKTKRREWEGGKYTETDFQLARPTKFKKHLNLLKKTQVSVCTPF
jgi:hypothetical protein